MTVTTRRTRRASSLTRGAGQDGTREDCPQSAGYVVPVYDVGAAEESPNASSRVRRHGWRWVLAAVAAAGVAVLAHNYFLVFFSTFGLFGNGIDTVVYRHGAGTILTAEPLYEFALFEAGLPFTYPPFAALTFVPLALMPVPTALAVANMSNLLLVYLAVLASWRILGYRGVPTHVVSAGLAIAFTWLEPVRMTIWFGQINLLLLVLVLFDLGRPEGSRLRGIGVGIAAGLKLTPAFFVLYLLALRQWRAAALAAIAFAATVAAAFVVVPSDSWTYWTSTMVKAERIGLLSSPANQSMHGILARLWAGGDPPMWVWLLCAGSVAALGLWTAALAYRRGWTLLSLTICGLSTPMVSPFAWGHHWVWCIPLAVLALDFAARRPRWWGYLLPVVLIGPMLAWYFTDYRGIAAIGIFMFAGPPWLRLLVQLAYPAVFLIVIATTVIAHRTTKQSAATADQSQSVHTGGIFRVPRKC